MSRKKPLKVPPPPIESTKAEDTLLEQAGKCYKDYGAYTIEQRAIPDIRDGLKPVQRRVLYEMYVQGLRPDSKQTKAAKVSGSCMGKWHAHGSAAIYQAMVNMAGTKAKGAKPGDPWFTKNSPEPAIWGFGNWGGAETEAGAERYTECKLSQYAQTFLLDPEYLKAVPYVPNYDDTLQEPLLLPAKVPNVLVNGASGISVGVTTEIPSFELRGVIECSKLALQGTLEAKHLVQYLRPSYAYGGTWERSEFKALVQGHQSHLTVYAGVQEAENGDALITCQPPRMRLARMFQIIESVPETARVFDESGPHGFRLRVQSKRLSDDARKKWYSTLHLKLTARQPVTINLTRRKPNGEVAFGHYTLLDIFRQWASWRIALEKRVIKNRIDQNHEKQKAVELLLLGVVNVKVLLDSLKQADSEAYLAQKLKIEPQSARWLLDQPVRRFKAQDRKELESKIKGHQQQNRALNARLKEPVPGIVEELCSVKVL